MFKVELGKPVKFPSGFEAEVNKMTGKTQNILTNKKKLRDGTAYDEIIKDCIPYAKEYGLKNWLVGDIYFAIIAIRIVTFGERLMFKAKCPYCEDNGTYWADLSQLEVKYLNGRPTEDIEFVLPNCGKKVKFHLLKHEHQKLMQEILRDKEDKLVTALLALRTDEIEGEDMVTEDFFDYLDAADILAYREFIEECDCGVDTTMHLTCSRCDTEFEEELPVNHDFFFPKSQKKK